MVIWITGISGTGKSTLGNYFFKKFKKKYPATVFFDGDQFRSIFFNDINYTLKDRDTNAIRLTSLVKYISSQKVNIIISANLTSQRFRDWCKKNVKNYFEVYIDTPMKTLIEKRDYKKLYKNAIKGKIKNVVGIDIKFKLPKKPDMIIYNNAGKKKLFSHYGIIIKNIKKNKIKIY